MPTEKLRATVQYGDWKGTASADNSDSMHKANAESYLKAEKKIQADELLVGVEVWVGENHGKHKDPVSVTFLIASPRNFEAVEKQAKSGALKVRKVRVQMKAIEFFGLFKRFSIALSNHGILHEREYTYGE